MPEEKRDVDVPDEKIPDTVTAILESDFWLQTISPQKIYERIHDDHDGTMEGILSVMFTQDGDACVWITGGVVSGSSPTLRFRMPFFGGGLSPKTRVALLILAEAIRQDNEQNPYPK